MAVVFGTFWFPAGRIAAARDRRYLPSHNERSGADFISQRHRNRIHTVDRGSLERQDRSTTFVDSSHLTAAIQPATRAWLAARPYSRLTLQPEAAHRIR